MDPAIAPILAATIWFVVCLGYVLLAGMGTFWAIVWPEGQAVRRLRGLAVAGLALISLGTVIEALIGILVGEYPRGETVTDESGRGCSYGSRSLPLPASLVLSCSATRCVARDAWSSSL